MSARRFNPGDRVRITLAVSPHCGREGVVCSVGVDLTSYAVLKLDGADAYTFNGMRPENLALVERAK